MTEDLKTPDCIECGSRQVRHDPEFGFYKCENCSTVWSNDEDDPDYEEYDSDDCPSCGADSIHIVWDSMEESKRCEICDYMF
ncbi:hypothetical protein NIES4103_68800 (plasmid) [Nostoc sp. NIES-4103]|nr:hypothetical protein NIES4103_68800 [Nostoc sp. NIES-4103]